MDQQIEKHHCQSTKLRETYKLMRITQNVYNGTNMKRKHRENRLTKLYGQKTDLKKSSQPKPESENN